MVRGRWPPAGAPAQGVWKGPGFSERIRRQPGAIRLYEKLGFAFNGELDTKGERVMVYTVPRPDAPTEREERERAHDRSV